MIHMHTNHGKITLELDADKAPETTSNFVEYARSGFYDGTVFHRVIGNFMIQGGGFEPGMKQKQTRPPVANEAKNGLQNVNGSIAMARTSDPNSATSQFFINLKDNAFLDHQARTPAGWGYAVFGRVTAGMAVVDKIAAAETGAAGPFPQDAPLQAIVIEKATVENP